MGSRPPSCFGAELDNIADRQLDALEQGALRGVTITLSLEDRDSLLSNLELSTVTQHSNAGQSLPGRGLAVILGIHGLVFCGVGLDDPVVKPHVSDCHTVLGQSSGLVRANG